ncbi:MAG: DUF2520 domain-containing protein [Ginsengibacter sp.]
MKVVIVGSGNVATVLGKAFHKAGHEILQVISKNIKHAKALAIQFGSDSGNDITAANKEADVYLFAINDNVLYHLHDNVHLGNKLVMHTAGSVSKDVLNNISGNYGVLYPLLSLSKDYTNNPPIPFLIDGNTAETIGKIKAFAETISKDISYATDEERVKYHISAVVVSNFANHLYALAEDFCASEHLDFSRLYPLINETTARINKLPAKEVQTGPAVREDIYTLGKHLQLLTKQPDLKYIYLKLTESILKLHQLK